MKATLVFSSHESFDVSIGLVFTPCITWIFQNRTVLNPHRDLPSYKSGDFQKLTGASFFQRLLAEGKIDGKSVCVVVQRVGNGCQEDIDILITDIKKTEFQLFVSYM